MNINVTTPRAAQPGADVQVHPSARAHRPTRVAIREAAERLGISTEAKRARRRARNLARRGES